MYSISAIRAFTDNYIWCIHDDEKAVIVDPGQALPVFDFLASKSLTLESILITHHHYDHTGGVAELLGKFPSVEVYGPVNPKIADLNYNLSEGRSITVLNNKIEFSVIEVPGHTLDHIAYVNDELLFCGDTLFSAGCGRMFEGEPEMFWRSLEKLKKLPDTTKVFCAHEYTLANIKFARYIDPDNDELKAYELWSKEQRAQDKITLPSTIGKECAVNPFLKCDQSSFASRISKHLELDDNSAVEVFAAIRAAKDNF